MNLPLWAEPPWEMFTSKFWRCASNIAIIFKQGGYVPSWVMGVVEYISCEFIIMHTKTADVHSIKSQVSKNP